MLKKMNLILCLLLAAPSVFASTRVGNGGNVVICKSSASDASSVASIGLLDIEEEIVRNPGFSWGLEEKAGDVNATVRSILEKLKRVSPQRAKFYSSVFSGFLASQVFVDNLRAVDDVGPLAMELPKGCALRQAAAQYFNAFGDNERKLFIDKGVFDQLSFQNKVALYLHEIVTAETAEWSLDGGNWYRPFVALLASDRLQTLSEEEFVTQTLKLGFAFYEAHGLRFTFDVRGGKFDTFPMFENGVLVSGTVYPDTEVRIENAGAPVFSIHIRDYVRFYPNGVFRAVTLSRSSTVTNWNGLTYSVPAGTRLFFNERGFVTDIALPPKFD